MWIAKKVITRKVISERLNSTILEILLQVHTAVWSIYNTRAIRYFIVEKFILNAVWFPIYNISIPIYSIGCILQLDGAETLKSCLVDPFSIRHLFASIFEEEINLLAMLLIAGSQNSEQMIYFWIWKRRVIEGHKFLYFYYTTYCEL